MKHQFSFQTELGKLEKSVLVELPNPKYLKTHFICHIDH